MMKRFQTLSSWQLVAYSLVSCSLACANPSDPIVMSGSASFENIDSLLSITTSEQAIINWGEFSIAEGELTQFFQPSSQSVVVNQVTSDLSSVLLGSLKANGKIFLLNPNGILIGQEASIDTSSFIAATLSVNPEDLLNGNREVLFQGSSTATIVNLGAISAWDGDIYLVGYQVDNQGSIDAPNGTAAIAAGQEVLLKPSASEKIVIRPSLSKYENSLTGIDNSGSIAACRAELKADGNAYAMAINHTGAVDAFGVQEQNGEVFLVTENGKNGIYGTVTAKNENGTGGNVKILGKNIALLDEANVDTSGEWGGGPILIGGDLSGKNPDVMNAESTYVSQGALIVSDASSNGDAGKVIVWADNSTSFYGKISARGGPSSGDGGFVEVSGKESLDFQGEADRFAPNGTPGTLLLDPTDITWTFNTIGNSTGSSPFEPTGCPSTIGNSSVTLGLFSGPVTIQSSGSIVCGADLGMVNINAASVFNFSSANTLTITTQNIPGVTQGDIILSTGTTMNNTGPGDVVFTSVRDIIINGIYDNTGAGTTTLQADRDINAIDGFFASTPVSGGTLTLNATRDVNVTGAAVVGSGNANGPFTITAGRDVNISGSAAGNGFVSQVASVTAARNISLTGSNTGFATIDNFFPLATVITAMTGDLTITGGSSANNCYAVITSTSMTIDVPNGNILLTGGSGTSTNCYAEIDNNIGNLHINCSGTLTLQGGSSPSGGGGAFINNTLNDVFINTGGAITLTGGTAPILGNNALITTGTGAGNIVINTPDDLTLTGALAPNLGNATISPQHAGDLTINANNINLIGNNAQVGLVTFDGSLTATAAGSVNLMPGPNFSSSYIWVNVGTAPHNLLVIAGADIYIGPSNNYMNALVLNYSPTGTTTLVCDNDFPTSPLFGPGKFTNNGDIRTGGGPLWIFTSRRQLNTNTVPINGVPFFPGPIYVDTTIEQWYTWYNNTSNGYPFKIFYKDKPTPTPVQMQTAVTNFNAAAFEFLQDIDNYDVFWYWNTHFSTQYDKPEYNEFHHHDGLTSSDVFGKKIFHLLRKSYKEQNGKVIYLIK